MGPGNVHFAQVERHNEDLIPGRAGFGQDLTGGACHEGAVLSPLDTK